MPNLRSKTWTTTTPATVGDAQYWEDHLISDSDAAKIATSVQTVNNTAPDASGNVDVSVGHTIQNASGTDMPYQSTLQFTGADVSNDSVNGKTVVDCHGEKGDAATIAVGTVTTLPAGSDATVTNAGTSSAAVFNFGIPQGQDGSGAVDSVNGKTGIVVLTATDVSALPDSTTIPTSLSELSDDTTHRLVTDAEKTAWNAKVSESLLKDTVGWVGKNKIPATLDIVKSINTLGTWNGNVYTRRGNTFTVNLTNDGYIDNVVVGGTNDGTGEAVLTLVYEVRDYLEVGNSYFYSGCPSGGSASTYGLNVRYYGYEYGSGKNFTLANQSGNIWYGIVVFKDCPQLNNIVFKPFLIDADITDHTYAPYHPPVSDVITDVYGVMGENGAKNYAAVRATNETLDTVVFTSNGDGTYTVNGSKTAAGHSDYAIDFPIKAGRYKINGCPDGGQAGGTDKFALVLRKSDYTLYTDINGNGIVIYDSSEREFIVPSDTTLKITLQVWYGYTASSLIFKPMIWDARDTNPDFVPYAMTNRELTDAVTPVESAVTNIVEGAEVTTDEVGNHLIKYGKIVFLQLSLKQVTATAWDTTIFTIPEGYRPKYNYRTLCANTNIMYNISTSGNVKLSSSVSNQYISVTGCWITD